MDRDECEKQQEGGTHLLERSQTALCLGIPLAHS